MTVRKTALTLKALAAPNRLRIINLLRERSMCVCELAHVISITQPSVSRHLLKLKSAGLVSAAQGGLWSFYSLSDPKECPLLPEIMKSLENCPELARDIKKAREISGPETLRKICSHRRAAAKDEK